MEAVERWVGFTDVVWEGLGDTWGSALDRGDSHAELKEAQLR